MDVTYYEFRLNGRRRARTREQIAALRIPAKQTIKNEDGSTTEEDTEISLLTDERIDACLHGNWHTVAFRENITGADLERARALQYKPDGLGRMMEQPWRYGRAWVITLLQKWDYDEDDFPLNESSLNRLGDEANIILEQALVDWKDNLYPNDLTISIPGSSS